MDDDGVEILLVEDNDNDELLALHAFMKNNVVNKVHVVRDGVEALDYIFCTGAYAKRKIENPKLVLLDLKLPFIDGIEVLRRIRGNPRTRLVPVVVLTTSSQESDVIETYALGDNSYIVKPVDYDQFSAVAKQLEFYWLQLNRQPARAHGTSLEVMPNL